MPYSARKMLTVWIIKNALLLGIVLGLPKVMFNEEGNLLPFLNSMVTFDSLMAAVVGLFASTFKESLGLTPQVIADLKSVFDYSAEIEELKLKQLIPDLPYSKEVTRFIRYLGELGKRLAEVAPLMVIMRFLAWFVASALLSLAALLQYPAFMVTLSYWSTVLTLLGVVEFFRWINSTIWNLAKKAPRYSST